jgi:hypothetical protein
MIYLTVASLALLVVAIYFGTSGEIAHAAISGNALVRKRFFPFAGFYRDMEGKALDLTDSNIAKVTGDSCEWLGIRDGNVVVYRNFDSANDKPRAGEIVIINSEKDGKRPHRFRCVESVEPSGMVKFLPHGRRELKPKPINDIIGVVTHVRT